MAQLTPPLFLDHCEISIFYIQYVFCMLMNMNCMFMVNLLCNMAFYKGKYFSVNQILKIFGIGHERDEFKCVASSSVLDYIKFIDLYCSCLLTYTINSSFIVDKSIFAFTFKLSTSLQTTCVGHPIRQTGISYSIARIWGYWKKQQQQILPSSSDFQKIIAFKILSINPYKLEGRKHVNKTNDI